MTGLVHDYNFVSSYSGDSAAAHESAPDVNTLFTNLAAKDFTLPSSSAAKAAGIGSLGGKSAPSDDIVAPPVAKMI